MRSRTRASAILVASLLMPAGPARALDFGTLDLAKPVPVAEPCPEKGPGLVRLPGGRTCTRLSGRVAAGAAVRAGGPEGRTAPVLGAGGHLAIDNRTPSDLGEIRTYVRVGGHR